MNIEQEHISATGIRFIVWLDGQKIGRAYLYLLSNDLHAQPFGFLEDVYIDEALRGRGIGSQLVQAVINEAKKQGCYKLICTSRESKPEVHALYKKLGFQQWGFEFRINL